MRRRMGRPGLLGTMAKTAVVAGTASATAGAVHRRQANKQSAIAEQQAAQNAAYESQAQVAELQAQLAAQQAQGAAEPAPAQDDLMSKLQQLADLKAQGILDDAEFAAAKAKLLA